jgi:hypothetical protein
MINILSVKIGGLLLGMAIEVTAQSRTRYPSGKRIGDISLGMAWSE